MKKTEDSPTSAVQQLRLGALALYIVCESVATLVHHESPDRSIPGVLIASAAVIIMPLLARAKTQ